MSKSSDRVLFEGQYHVEPALRILVEVTGWICDEGTEHAGGPVDLRWVTVERVEIDHVGLWMTVRVEDAHYGIDSLQDEPVARAQALIRWLKRKLIATICKALIAVIDTGKGR